MSISFTLLEKLRPTSTQPLTTMLFFDDQEKAKAEADIQENDSGLLSPTKITPENHVVDLSKFRSEVPSTFLGLRVLDQDSIPIPPPAEESLALVPLKQDSKRKSPMLFDEAEKKEQKKKKKVIRRDNSQPQAGPVDLSPDFLRIIESAEPPVFLYRKCLTPTDVHRGQNRLLINDTENVKRFITRDEEHEIFRGPNNFIEVVGVDCKGRGFDLRLSVWGDHERKRAEASTSTSNNTNNYSKNKKIKPPSIIFNRQWCDLLEANEVEPNDIAELWGFRRDGRFCLAANFIHHRPRT